MPSLLNRPQGDIGLLAHWKRAGPEEEIAEDGAEAYDGTLDGGLAWEPSAGKRSRALRFDGGDDHVSTDSVLYPSTRDPGRRSGKR